MGKLEGKVAFITGAARGQGRAHAVRLASEGADIIAVDICDKVASCVAEPATPEDLQETVNLVEKHGRRMLATQADVRDYEAVAAAVNEGIKELGRLDIVVANAGVWGYGLAHELSSENWQEVIDICLTGVWHTCKATVPHLIEQGQGGSVIITSSACGVRGVPNGAHYVAAKHGVTGLMKTMAIELGPHSIRVNTIHPGNVNTNLIHNQPTYDLFAPDLENPTKEDVAPRFQAGGLLPEPWAEPEDIAAMSAFLASEDARFITGSMMSVDLGVLARW